MHAGDITLLKVLQTFRKSELYKEPLVGDLSLVMLRLWLYPRQNLCLFVDL